MPAEVLIQNPLQSLTFIAAPALLTNACSLLVLSTSNRFARAVDRTRLLVANPPQDGGASLGRTEGRALMLGRALAGFYIAVASFACSTFIGLIGSAVATAGHEHSLTLFTETSLTLAAIGVLCIAVAAGHLVFETWNAYQGLVIEAKTIGSDRRGPSSM